ASNNEMSNDHAQAGESGPPPIRLIGAQKPNDRYRIFSARRRITVPKMPLIRANDRVFTMGSCFAREIRKALVARGQACLPDYNRIEVDPQSALVDTLPPREHMNFYSSFSILLQLEQILGLWTPEPDDYWKIDRLSVNILPWTGTPNYQDPYRRLVIARSPR